MGIVGYLGYNLNSSVPLNKLTLGMWEVVTPTSPTDMTLICDDGGDIDRCAATVRACHNAGKPCLISFFAPYSEPAYNNMFSNSSLRSALIANLVKIVNKYGADGIDGDIECNNNGPPYATAEAQTAFYSAMRSGLGPGKIITATQNYGSVKLEPGVLNYIDVVQVMTYDDTTVWYFTLDSMKSGLNLWLQQGFPASKISGGINFHTRTALVGGSWGMSYKQVLSTYNPPPSANQAGSYYYNGADLVSQKAVWLRSQGFWGAFGYDVGGDAPDDPRSLLTALYNQLGGHTFSKYDLNQDGVVDVLDLSLVAQHFGERT
jgi:hypothetical protein